MTTTQTPPDWWQDLVDVAKVVGVKTAGTTKATKQGAKTANKVARRFVRWLIAFISVFPVLLAGLAMLPDDVPIWLIPTVTMAMLVGTLLTIAFKWDQVVVGVAGIGIAAAVVSDLGKRESLVAIASTLKRFGTSAGLWVVKVIALELLAGIYWTYVPVAEDVRLVPGILLLMVAITALALVKWSKLAIVIAVILAIVTGSFFSDEAGALAESIGAQVSAVTSSSAPAPGSAQGGIIVVTESADRIIHVGDDFTPFQFPLVPGEDTPVFSLPSTAEDADWRTEPLNEPYEVCWAPAGRFVGCYASVNKYGRHDVDFDFSVTDIWFRGMPETAPGTVIVVTPIR